MIVTEKHRKETGTLMLSFFQNRSLDLVLTFGVGNNVCSSFSLCMALILERVALVPYGPISYRQYRNTS